MEERRQDHSYKVVHHSYIPNANIDNMMYLTSKDVSRVLEYYYASPTNEQFWIYNVNIWHNHVSEQLTWNTNDYEEDDEEESDELSWYVQKHVKFHRTPGTLTQLNSSSNYTCNFDQDSN